MSKIRNRESALSLRVTVESSPAWQGWPGARRALADFRAALEAILDAWRLPVKPLLHWRIDPLADWPGNALLRLSLGVDGPEAIVRVEEPADATATSVARALDLAAHALPDAWLLPRVLLRLGFAEDRHALVREAARSGFAPWRFDPTSHATVARGLDDLAPSLVLFIPSSDQEDERSWRDAHVELAESMFGELGAWLPPLQVEVDPELPAGAVRLRINDLPLPRIDSLARGFIVAVAAPDRLTSIGITATPIRNPYGGESCGLVADSEAARKAIGEAGFIVWDSRAYSMLSTAAAVRRHAWALWSRVATEAALERQARAFEPLVRAWQERFPTNLLHELLTSLLREKVSIRNLRGILEAMLAVECVATIDTVGRLVLPPLTGQVLVSEKSAAQALTAEPSTAQWLEQVRVALAPSIISRHLRGATALAVYELDSNLETQLRDAPASLRVADARRRLTSAMCIAFGQSDPEAPKVLLTTRAARAELQRLISDDFPEVTVLSGAELGVETAWEALGRIAWPHSMNVGSVAEIRP